MSACGHITELLLPCEYRTPAIKPTPRISDEALAAMQAWADTHTEDCPYGGERVDGRKLIAFMRDWQRIGGKA
jgi:hypothetical protein